MLDALIPFLIRSPRIAMFCQPITIDTIASVFTAIGTVALSLLVVYGDGIKDYVKGPRLAVSFLDPKGDLTQYSGSGPKAYFYHLKVKNKPGRNAAQGTRVVIRAISKRTPGGTFVQIPVVYPLQLAWTPSEFGEFERIVLDESTCDFGNVKEVELVFRPVTVVVPNNFKGVVASGECLRYEVVATGTNVLSPQPTVLEVSWNGQWTTNQEEMTRNLVIREVKDLLKT